MLFLLQFRIRNQLYHTSCQFYIRYISHKEHTSPLLFCWKVFCWNHRFYQWANARTLVDDATSILANLRYGPKESEVRESVNNHYEGADHNRGPADVGSSRYTPCMSFTRNTVQTPVMVCLGQKRSQILCTMRTQLSRPRTTPCWISCAPSRWK